MQALTTVIGCCTATTARLLSIFPRATDTVARVAWEAGGQRGETDVPLADRTPYANAVFDLANLPPSSRVRYAVASALDTASLPTRDAILAQPDAATFALLPSTRPIRIALVSCNDLITSSIPKERRAALWDALAAEIAAGNVDLIVHAGDQIYGDEIPAGWLPSEPRVAAYRRHYVNTWTTPSVAAVLRSVPSLMMWDDHEIYDGYGSNDNDSTAAAQSRYAVAEQAFREFQVPLNPAGFDAPNSHAWSFVHEGVGVLAVDGRKHRMWKDFTILGDTQLAAIGAELARLATQKVQRLFVVVGTPPVFVPLLAALKLAGAISQNAVDDLRDGWVATNNRAECRRLLLMLLDFAGRTGAQVTFVAGDIHVGTLGQIDTTLSFSGTSPRIYQVTASGVSRPPPGGLEAALLGVVANGASMNIVNTDITGELLPISGSPQQHLLARRNFAILKVNDSTGNAWDPNGNLWVEFVTELEANNVARLEQALLRP